MPRHVTTVDDLRAIVGHPIQAVANKVKDRLSEAQQDWLAHSPLGFIATTDAEGRVDVSPKGDPPGFVHIIDDTTIAIPERPGNKRVGGKRPILALEIDVDEVFFHCAKAFLRSDAWNPQTWDPTAVPSVAWLAKAIKPDLSDEQLDEYYAEDNMRKVLY
jgi:predicted pyridoxine 5'-phosphate oxidase superfamily flavin-nucleotide-binding protein